jgi:squalene synthase HpnC
MGAAAFELAPGRSERPGPEWPSAPDAAAVMARAGGENFPVAMRLLSPRHRRALLAVYGFARLADELGDELRGDRLAALDWLGQELDAVYSGRSPIGGSSDRLASAPLFVSLRRAVVECGLPHAPFARLIEANRVDQRVVRYQSWEQLQSYCHLSADPVGELVLAIFELLTPDRVALSDRVCTGLQLTEHLQDVGEDLAHGRIYLPQEDLERFGCSHEQLASRGPNARAAMRDVVAFELARARDLLWAGAPLAASMSGRARLAVAAFAAGGLAACEEIERTGFDVLADCRSRRSAIGGVRPATRRLRLRWLLRVLRRSRSAR